jgi:nicotinate-nucleotide pyrophosphorylase (carboxylating)
MTIAKDELTRIIRQALAEDIGTGDITSELTIPANATAEMVFVAADDLVACGTFIPEAVFKQLGSIKTKICAAEGKSVKKNTILVTATGNARILLAGERVALNLMQRMSGVATLTREYVDAIKGTKAKILDTRKTMPGLRLLDKYAVRTGSGRNHRMRLDDMVLIKDNHIVIGSRVSGGGLREIIEHVKTNLSSRYPIIIECDTLSQVKESLAAKPDRILLDNMPPAQLKKAVKLAAGKIPLEASGGVSLATVRAIAETGVNYISVGRLTHSAPAADIRADIAFKNRS